MDSSTQQKSDLVDFIKNHSIFNVLDRSIIEGLSLLVTELVCGPGHIVFKEGDAADAIYIIKSGAVAVLQSKPQAKVVAYLTAGECFGEMAIVQDSPRTATIRVPEEAVILKLPSIALVELTKKYPAMTVELADLINRRTTSGDTPFKAPGLQGNLAFFDLPTVIQTVLSSRKNGVLLLFGRSGKIIGRVTVRDSMIVQAQYEHLKGDSALFELMNLTQTLDFTFDNKDVAPDQVDLDLIKKQPYMLLLEGARRADELPKLLKVVGWPNATYEQVIMVPDLNRLGEHRKELCRQIWALIEMGSTVESMSKQVSADRYTLMTALHDMIVASYLRLEPNKRGTEEVIKRTIQLSKPAAERVVANATREYYRESTEILIGNPFEVVKLVNAVNGVGTNLGTIFGKMEIRLLMQESLRKSSYVFPCLKGIKVYVDSPALDMRAASSEFSDSPEACPALIHLTIALIEAAAELMNKAKNK